MDGALCENAGTETSSPWRFREPGSTARCVVCAQRRDGRGKGEPPPSRSVSGPVGSGGRQHGPRASLLWGGERSPAPPGGGRGRGAPRGSLSGARPAGGQDGPASGPPASGAEGSGGDDGEPRPSDGGLELFAHRELNVFVRSGCLSEPAPWAAWTARFTVYSLEDGRPGPGISQEVSLLGLETAISSPCPHAAGRGGGFFLAVSFPV